jgi:hypothetical protein
VALIKLLTMFLWTSCADMCCYTADGLANETLLRGPKMLLLLLLGTSAVPARSTGQDFGKFPWRVGAFGGGVRK